MNFLSSFFLKEGKDTEHVYDYCARQNRPFNATNLADALQKEGIKKAAAQRYLDTLVSDNRLSLTERGKSKVYFAIQPEKCLTERENQRDGTRGENETGTDSGEETRVAK